MHALLQKLDEIHSCLERSQQRPDDLWNIKDIAAYLKISTRSAYQVSKHPHFPIPIRPPTQGLDGVGGSCRWYAGEVKQFIKRFRQE